MNKNFVKLAFVGFACAAFCTTAFAAPKGGHHGGNGRMATAASRPARASHSARPTARTSMAAHASPARHADRPAAARHDHFRPEPRHHASPPRVARHHVPHHARYWARSVVPMLLAGALHAWEWVEQAWVLVVNGVYHYGDGYYYDGFYYYYNAG